jgi:hypothetical protein
MSAADLASCTASVCKRPASLGGAVEVGLVQILKTCSAPCHWPIAINRLSEQSAFCRCHCAALRCACSAQRPLAARPAQGSTTSHLFTDHRRWRGVYGNAQLNPVSSKTSAQRPEAARCHRPRAPPPALFAAVQQVRTRSCSTAWHPTKCSRLGTCVKTAYM